MSHGWRPSAAPPRRTGVWPAARCAPTAAGTLRALGASPSPTARPSARIAYGSAWWRFPTSPERFSRCRGKPPSAPERGAAAAAAEGCGKRLRFCQGLGESVQSTTHILRIRLRFYKTSTAYRETPQSGPKGLPAPLSGALFSLPPLGVVLRAANQDSNDCRWQSYLCFVPRSGKGGDVGWLRAVHVTT